MTALEAVRKRLAEEKASERAFLLSLENALKIERLEQERRVYKLAHCICGSQQAYARGQNTVSRMGILCPVCDLKEVGP